MQQQQPVVVVEPATTYSKVYEFVFGPTPKPPEIRMKEIEEDNKLRRKKAEREYEDKKWDVEQSTKKLQAASMKGNEATVRQVATEHVSLLRLQRQSMARLNLLDTAMHRMSEISVRGATDKNLIEYMQCQNELMSKTANPLMVQRVTSRFLAQKDAMATSNVMIDEALESSEDEEANDEANEEIEALVQKSLTSSAIDLLGKMPVITTNRTHAKPIMNKSPTTLANEIQQYTSGERG